MEFLTIIAVGTVIAVWVVADTRPRCPVHFDDDFALSDNVPMQKSPPWRKEIALSLPMGEQEYLEAVERYDNDPHHEPFPLPPPTKHSCDNARE